jgi:hypothetical protein
MAVQRQHFDDDHRDDFNESSQVSIDLNPALKQRIRKAAHSKNQPVREYIKNILEQTVPTEADLPQNESPSSSDLIEQLYRLREQIIQYSKGEIFEDSTELLRQQREERAKYLEEPQELA